MRKIFFCCLLPAAILAGLAVPVVVRAHGAVLQHQVVPAILVEASYDSGQPMARSQVVIYAPDDPARPWLTALSDDRGRFSFVPDPALPGTWSVQVRQAGHGAMIHIPLPLADPELSAGQSPPPPPASFGSPARRWLMALAIVWGCIGTALFFVRRRH